VKRFELERAISENELVLHYQPMVAVPSRQLTGVEALVPSS
jgi:sensor c-di-GMP phosphodiesterase-like protein